MTAPSTYLAFAAVFLWLCSSQVTAQPFLQSTSPAAPWPSVQIAGRAESDPQAFGPLRLGQSEAVVREKLGAPESISPRSMMMSSDESTYTWDYASLGVTLYYSALDESSSGTLMAIRAKPPCNWTAVGGLKVGMSIEAASQILRKLAGHNISPLGSVGTEMAGLYFELSETAVAARLELGMVSVLYIGPNLP